MRTERINDIEEEWLIEDLEKEYNKELLESIFDYIIEGDL